MGYIYKTHVKNLQISGQKRCLISVDAPYDRIDKILPIFEKAHSCRFIVRISYNFYPKAAFWKQKFSIQISFASKCSLTDSLSTFMIRFQFGPSNVDCDVIITLRTLEAKSFEVVFHIGNMEFPLKIHFFKHFTFQNIPKLHFIIFIFCWSEKLFVYIVCYCSGAPSMKLPAGTISCSGYQNIYRWLNWGLHREPWQEDHFERSLKYFGGFPTSKSDFPPK